MKRALITALLALMVSSHAVASMAIRDLCDVQGARANTLSGVGIVVGLRGTGDSAEAALLAQKNLLDRLGLDIQNLDTISSKNVAICTVTATLPPFSKEGTAIDVTVQSIYDAKTLEGGQLLETYLRGPSGDTVYAVASGPISVGGFDSDVSAGTSVRKNHGTVGRIPGGGMVEQEVPASITDGERLTLLVKRPSFEAADGIRQQINLLYGEGTADALSGGAVRVKIPLEHQTDLVSFIAELNKLKVDVVQPAVVVINERTGTIVVGGDVMIKPCQVAHGSLTVKIATTTTPVPALPFTDAQPTAVANANVAVEEPEVYLAPVEGTSAAEVAQALNALRLTPRDMIAIFDALNKAGALEAELEIR